MRQEKSLLADGPPPVPQSSPPPLPAVVYPPVVSEDVQPLAQATVVTRQGDKPRSLLVWCLTVVALVLPAALAVVSVSVVPRRPESTAQPPGSDAESFAVPKSESNVIGKWKVIHEVGGDTEPIVPRYHYVWEFLSDGRLIINGDRTLQFEVVDRNRLQVYNRVGQRRISIYSCLASLRGDDLAVHFHAGDRFPEDFWEALIVVLEMKRL